MSISISFSPEWIEKVIKKLNERKIAFIQDEKTIEIAKEVHHSGELKFYEKYIRNKDLLFQVRMGLVLRKVESDKERLHNLRDKIFHKFKEEGLHRAELVQNGILNRYLGILLDELPSIEELQKEIEDLLKNIEHYTVFVRSIDVPEKVMSAILSKIQSFSPPIFIVSGITPANNIIKECLEKHNLENELKKEDYLLERIETSEKIVLFFRKILPKL